MKKLILLTVFLAGCILAKTSAQSITAVANIGMQPIWGPVGYDHVDYYYLPDIDIYYYVPQREYIYKTKKHWVTTSVLPSRYHDFDFYTAHKVVINEDKPYLNNSNRTKYAQFKAQHDQLAIRDNHEQKYLENKDHPEHDRWISSQNRQDQLNRLMEQDRVNKQSQQDQQSRNDLQSKEDQHNKEYQQNKMDLQNKENQHSLQNQQNQQDLNNNENNDKH
ncbi:MAG TPA: hypothetical protein VN721_05675 [Flavipsychrobacter sp.]|nr:hypothetical protein [Flavipsychrobacter sp.]